MKKLALILLAAFICLHASTLKAETVLQEIVVKDGDTLWSIANKYLKDPKSWHKLLRYNNLPSSDPNVILPGMRLKVPILLIKEKYRSAKLIKLLNKVLFRKKGNTSWKKANLDMMLFNDDGLRTMTESIASVKFYSGEVIKLEQNSLVILRPERRNDEVELLSGAVRASRSKVISANSEIMPRIIPRGEKPDYKTKIKPDKTTLVEVFRGVVDVTAQGKTVTLRKGFGTEVKYLQAPSAPHQLPPQIELGAKGELNADYSFKIPEVPKDRASITDIAQSAGSAKKGRVIGNIIEKYHIQLAYDRNFESLILDKTYGLGKGDIDFKKMGLKDGKYYFHIAYIDELGLEGQYSNRNTLIIDTKPPIIDIIYPEDKGYTDKEFIELLGITEPGATIVINDEINPIKPKGGFSRTIATRMGKNTITLEISDSSGNKSRKKLTFYRVEKGSKKLLTKDRKENNKKKFVIRPGSIFMGILSTSVILGVLALIIL